MATLHSRTSVLAGPIAMTVGAGIAVCGSFLRWIASGRIGRSSYELLGLVHRLGFAPSGFARLMIRAWPLVPLLLTASVFAAWWGLRSIGAAIGMVGGIYAGAVGGVVAFGAPDDGVIELSRAPLMTAVGGAVLVVGSMLTLLVRVPATRVPGPAPAPVPLRPRSRAVPSHSAGPPADPS